MFITPTQNQNFTALVPKAEYSGVVLKLTPKDKQKIANFMNKKTDLVLELHAIEGLLNKKKTIIESSGLMHRREKLLEQITTLDNLIKEVKVNRLEKQKARTKKLDLMV